MNEILADAKSKQYAVGCFNAINLDMIRGVLMAAESQKSPVILCHAEVHFKFTPLEMLAPILVEEARRAKVPVAILLDHGKSFSAIVRAMKLGFNAVMFDGSELPYQENLAGTAEVVKIAHELGVSVEAELGHVTRPKSGGAEGDDEDTIIDDKSLYTNPDQAKDFLEATRADALAVAFGTAHGVYLKKPSLDLERLAAIRRSVDVPLVMHGGSGLSSEDFKSSVKAGISKINYYTGMALEAARQVTERSNASKDPVFYHNQMMWGVQAIAEDVSRAINLFGSAGKV
jgi:fructose-bisphosphate aldolase class II